MIKLIFVKRQSDIPAGATVLTSANFDLVTEQFRNYSAGDVYLFPSLVTGWRGPFISTDIFYEFKGTWTYHEIIQAINRGQTA